MNTLVSDHPSTFPADHILVSTLERQEPRAMQVVVLPARAEDATERLTLRTVSVVAVSAMDDLSLATWEDAEWQ